jgi:hypothetical protein
MIAEPTIKEQLKLYGLEIVEVEGKFYIRTDAISDAGVRNEIISPTFKSLEELADWWNFIKDLFYIEEDIEDKEEC